MTDLKTLLEMAKDGLREIEQIGPRAGVDFCFMKATETLKKLESE